MSCAGNLMQNCLLRLASYKNGSVPTIFECRGKFTPPPPNPGVDSGSCPGPTTAVPGVEDDGASKLRCCRAFGTIFTLGPRSQGRAI